MDLVSILEANYLHFPLSPRLSNRNNSRSLTTVFSIIILVLKRSHYSLPPVTLLICRKCVSNHTFCTYWSGFLTGCNLPGDEQEIREPQGGTLQYTLRQHVFFSVKKAWHRHWCQPWQSLSPLTASEEALNGALEPPTNHRINSLWTRCCVLIWDERYSYLW